MQEVAEFLQMYGGWGVSIILGAGLIRFYWDFKSTIQEKDALIQKLNKDHHEEMIAVVRECTGVLTTVNDSLDRCEKRQEKI
jgi:hypothetical protein